MSILYSFVKIFKLYRIKIYGYNLYTPYKIENLWQSFRENYATEFTIYSFLNKKLLIQKPLKF